MTRLLCVVLSALTLLAALGCDLNSYFDPSRTGRFEYTPTTIPILERLDVIEHDRDPWAKATRPTLEDLIPGDLTYRIASGDFVTIEIFELIVQGQIWGTTRRVSSSGFFRLPTPLGDVRAAGLTAQEFQDEVHRLVDELVMPNPLVNVTVEEGAGFTFTMYGAVAGTGLYALRSPDFRLVDALAQAGGIPLSTRRVYLIRQVPLTEDVIFDPSSGPTRAVPGREAEPVDIEELIRRLDQPQPPASGRDEGETDSQAPSQEPPIDIEDLINELDEGQDQPGGVAPAAFAQDSDRLLDIDELKPRRAPPAPQPGPVIDTSVPGSKTGHVESFIYVQESDEWVPVRPTTAQNGDLQQPSAAQMVSSSFVERIIEIDYQRLKKGDSSYNVIIRPDDRIYVEEAVSGVVYVDGEILRPGVYNLPFSGRLTLSRLVAAAGGPGPLSIPTRVDLTRVVGENREATIRLNLAAIRNRTQPDIVLRPDDHIILGTNFWATPLAVFRNGLRMTYGFGFLLDRNFGNDVFGPAPFSRQ